MADEIHPLPAPLTPADCDLQDFKFMPLDVQRLRDSDLASEQTPEDNWAAVLLWAASWHQIPAASLPDVDATIAKWAGYMMRGRIDARWKEVKPGAMRGFILCSDGRWYHPVVAEKANEAWTAKLKQRLKTECGRIKKHNERHGTSVPFPDFETWLAAGCPVGQPLHVPGDKSGASPGQTGGVPGETPSKGQETGTGDRDRGQGQQSSAPDGAGGAAPPPPPPPAPTPAPTPAPAGTDFDRRKSATWKAAKSFLGEKGMAKDQAGTYLGALHRDHKALGDEAFLAVLEDMVKVRPAEPQSWLVAAFQLRVGQRPNRQTQLEDQNRALAGDWAQGGSS